MNPSIPTAPPRLVEYFLTCGISQDSAAIPKDDRVPITNLDILSEKEFPPAGWEKVLYTISGNAGSLNGTSMFTTKLYIAIERDPNKNPITEVAVIFGNEPKPMGFLQLDVSLNKGGIGKDVYLCFTRTYPSGKYREVVVDLLLIQPKAGEKCPSDYMLVNKNLNAGSFRTPLFLCIKKNSESPLKMLWKPVVLDRYPFYDIKGSQFPEMVPLFCYPQGADVIVGDNPPLPKCNTFILTLVSGLKLYGVCINFHEIFTKERIDNAKAMNQANSDSIAEQSVDEESTTGTIALEQAIEIALTEGLRVWLPKTVCLVSYWPFYNTFMNYLIELWRLTLGTSSYPPERFLSNLWETPLPQNSRVNVQLSIANSKIIFDRPPPDTFPLADYGVDVVFRCLSIENIIKVLAALFAERKILLVTTHSTLLTPVSEAIFSFMFPFQWQYAYIPVLPTAVLGLDLLSAPMPVFVGITATAVDPKILANGSIVFVNLDEDMVRVFGDAVPQIPTQFTRTLIQELKDEAHVHHIPKIVNERKGKIGSEFLFKQLPAMDQSPREIFDPKAARAAFLHLTVSLLADTKHRTCLKFPHVSASTTAREFELPGVDDVFDRKSFISLFPRNCQEFARHLTCTQAFARLADEKFLISSDRQSELDFFDHCCNYESKYLRAISIRQRNAREGKGKGLATLVQYLSTYTQKSLLYEVPEPEKKGLTKEVFQYPDGFPFLDEKLFYTPRPVDEKYMKNVESEKRDRILRGFKSAFFKSHMESYREKTNLKSLRKKKEPNLKRWLAAIYSSWFQIQVARLTGKSRELWEDRDELNANVEHVFKIFESLSPALSFKNAKAIREVELIYRSLLILCGEHNQSSQASVIFADMKTRGIETTGVTYVSYLNAIAARRTSIARNSKLIPGGSPNRTAKMGSEGQGSYGHSRRHSVASYKVHGRSDTLPKMDVTKRKSATSPLDLGSPVNAEILNSPLFSTTAPVAASHMEEKNHQSQSSTQVGSIAGGGKRRSRRTKSGAVSPARLKRKSVLPQKFINRVSIFDMPNLPRPDRNRSSSNRNRTSRAFGLGLGLGTRDSAARSIENALGLIGSTIEEETDELKHNSNQDKIDYSSIQIGAGPGSVPGFGEGKVSEFETKMRRDRKLVSDKKLENAPEIKPIRFCEREPKDQEMIRNLCDLSTAELMAGWSLHPERYKARSVRDPSLSFIPHIVIKYKTYSPLVRTPPEPASPRGMSKGKIDPTQNISTKITQTPPLPSWDLAKKSILSKSPKHTPSTPHSPVASLPPPATPPRPDGSTKNPFEPLKEDLKRRLTSSPKFQPTPPLDPPPICVVQKQFLQQDEKMKEKSTPHQLCVPFLSPLEVVEEITSAAQLCPEDFLSPDVFRRFHATLYWNLFWYVHALRLPYSFLVPNTLIPLVKVNPVEASLWIDNIILESDKFAADQQPQANISLLSVDAGNIPHLKAPATTPTNIDLKAPATTPTNIDLKAPATTPTNIGLKHHKTFEQGLQAVDENETTVTGLASPKSASAVGMQVLPSDESTPHALSQPVSPAASKRAERKRREAKATKKKAYSFMTRRGSMDRLRERVESLSAKEQKRAKERAETARRELGRIYIQIVSSLKRKKIASAMECFLDGRMYVVSTLDFLYTCLLSDQSELHLTLNWRGSMFSNLLKIVNWHPDLRSQYPSDVEFTKAFENVEQSFFRKDKRELITPQDQAPPPIVFNIYDEFHLKNFYPSNSSPEEASVGRDIKFK